MIRNLPRTGGSMFSNWKLRLKKFCLEFHLLVWFDSAFLLRVWSRDEHRANQEADLLNNLVDSLKSVLSVPGRPWTWRVLGHSYIVRSQHRCLVLSTKNKDYLVNFGCNCILFCSFESMLLLLLSCFGHVWLCATP